MQYLCCKCISSQANSDGDGENFSNNHEKQQIEIDTTRNQETDIEDVTSNEATKTDFGVRSLKHSQMSDDNAFSDGVL